MKKKYLLMVILAAGMLLVAGCSKEKTCRCAVIGTPNVRIIKISKGECEQLRVLRYYNFLQQEQVDSLVCTDFEFDIDTVFNNN
jgi:hypothetical protein